MLRYVPGGMTQDKLPQELSSNGGESLLTRLCAEQAAVGGPHEKQCLCWGNVSSPSFYPNWCQEEQGTLQEPDLEGRGNSTRALCVWMGGLQMVFLCGRNFHLELEFITVSGEEGFCCLLHAHVIQARVGADVGLF